MSLMGRMRGNMGGTGVAGGGAQDSACTQASTAGRPPRRNRRESMTGLMGADTSSDDVPGYSAPAPSTTGGGMFGGMGIKMSGPGGNAGGNKPTSFTNRMASKQRYDQKGSIASRLTKVAQGFQLQTQPPKTTTPTNEVGDARPAIARTSSLRRSQENFRTRMASLMPRMGTAQQQEQPKEDDPMSPPPNARPTLDRRQDRDRADGSTPSPTAKSSPGNSSVGSNSNPRPMMSMRNLNMNLPTVNLPNMNVALPTIPMNMEMTLPDLARFGSGFSRRSSATGDEPGAGWGTLEDSGVCSLGASGSELFSPMPKDDPLSTPTKDALEAPPPPPPLTDSTPTTTSSTIDTASTNDGTDELEPSTFSPVDGSPVSDTGKENLFGGSQTWAKFDASFSMMGEFNTFKSDGGDNGEIGNQEAGENDKDEDDEDEDDFDIADYKHVPDFRASITMPAQFTPAARFATAAASKVQVDISELDGESSLFAPPLEAATPGLLET